MTTNQTEDVPTCPLCGASGPFRRIAQAHVRSCPVCGLHFLSPRPTQDAIRRHYASGATYGSWQAERSERDRMWHRRLKLVQRVATNGTLLDIGTGDGHFLDIALAAGFAVIGTEISPAGAQAARARGHEVVEGPLGAQELPDQSFDVVTLWHVLEHVPDPGAVLTRVFRLLKPGGALLVAVPNELRNLLRARVIPGAFGPAAYGQLLAGDEIHLTFFTPATLKRALRRSGFDIRGFGVDNAYVHVTLMRQIKLGAHRLTSALTGSHLGIAMQALAVVPDVPTCR